ncbi:MAG: NUDIX hydrolase [Candidatus Kariarchaeaceae archaeon]|jgi:8-oxo-dGTP pyrophosphatase MutT (NUDIX family)
MLQILWEGSIPLDQVKWEFIPNNDPSLPIGFETLRKSTWEMKKKQFPNLYDGDIVFLNDFRIEDEGITLYVSEIKFSTITTLFENRISLPMNKGSLGFQATIFDINKEKVLVGQRSAKSEYKPGFYSMPGGIFEVSDLKSTVAHGILREVNEEIGINLENHPMLLRAIVREQNNIAVGLMVEISSDLSTKSEGLPANEEWQDHRVKWYTINEICSLGKEILEGLIYMKKKYCQ